MFRGLPLAATVGNLFRTLLSIPVALGLNFLILHLAVAAGADTIPTQVGLQIWAAVISKTASDLVAAVIEGTADRQHNLHHRTYDYTEKLSQVYAAFSQLEIRYPENDVPEMLAQPKACAERLRAEAGDSLRTMVINALDHLYFWMFQQRAETALRRIVRHLSTEEAHVLALSHGVLTRKRLVAEMLLDGLVGRRFERALAFYLSRADGYLSTITSLCQTRPALPHRDPPARETPRG